MTLNILKVYHSFSVLELPHVAVGAAIATKVGNPALAIPLAFASHFVLDQIPHWNPHFYTETQKYGKPRKQSTIIAVTDLALAAGLTLILAAAALPDVSKAAVMLIACFVSVLPDLVKSPYFFLKTRSKLMTKYVHFERSLQADTSFAIGMTIQAIVVLASLMWISA